MILTKTVNFDISYIKWSIYILDYTRFQCTLICQKRDFMKSRCQIWQNHDFDKTDKFNTSWSIYILKTATTEVSTNWSKCQKSLKIAKIDDFEQNWRFRQFWHFQHKDVNLYTGLYTNPVTSNCHTYQNIEIIDFEWSRQLSNTKESLPLLSTFSISWKSWNLTQKLKISDQKF